MAEVKEAVARAFPSSAAETVSIVCDWLSESEIAPHFDVFGTIFCGTEHAEIMSRSYFNADKPTHTPASDAPELQHRSEQKRFRLSDEQASLYAATALQREVFACIQSRDCCGFRRMEYVGLVLNGVHLWSIPYFFQIATDYIPAIAERVYVRLPTLTQTRHKQILTFGNDNTHWIRRLAQQVVTRWNWHLNCWYREEGGVELYRDLRDFPAYRTFAHFGLWPSDVAPRLLRTPAARRRPPAG